MKFRVYGEIKDTKTGQALIGASVKLDLAPDGRRSIKTRKETDRAE